MKEVSFKIYDASEDILAEVFAELSKVFGADVQVSADGVVSVRVPEGWDEAGCIAMIKSIISHIELRFTPRGPRLG